MSQNHIWSTNLRFNLDKDMQRKAWEYLQTMDRQIFKSYSQVVAVAVVDFFARYYRKQEDPYLETREREERFVSQIVTAVWPEPGRWYSLRTTNPFHPWPRMQSRSQISTGISSESKTDAITGGEP